MKSINTQMDWKLVLVVFAIFFALQNQVVIEASEPLGGTGNCVNFLYTCPEESPVPKVWCFSLPGNIRKWQSASSGGRWFKAVFQCGRRASCDPLSLVPVQCGGSQAVNSEEKE
jgi:hypothetical protein